MLLSAAVLALCFTACKTDVKIETDEKAADTTATATPDTAETAEAERPLDSVAEMKAWEAYMTPGEAHKMMADEAGTWTADMTFWHGPDSPAQKATTTANIKMIMGGRYQQSDYKGNVMGMPFEGHGMLAFDNAAKEYTSTWIDNMGTGIMVMKGKMSGDNKTIELHGEMMDPARGKAVKCREVYTIVDDNTRKMEMFDNKGGKEYKMMEIMLKRK